MIDDTIKQLSMNHHSAIEAFLRPMVEAGAKPEEFELVKETRYDSNTNQMQQVYRLQKRRNALVVIHERMIQLNTELEVIYEKKRDCYARKDHESLAGLERTAKQLNEKLKECAYLRRLIAS